MFITSVLSLSLSLSLASKVVEEEGVYECAICGAQFPGINMLGQDCQVLRKRCALYNCIGIQLFTMSE